MGVLVVIGTVILVFINVCVALMSFLFLCVGIGMVVAADIVRQYLWPILVKAFDQASSGAGDNFNILNDPDLDIFQLLKTLSIPIIVVSLVIFIICFFGCYGACCKNKCMLGIYSVVMTILVIGIVVGIVYLWLNESKFEKQMRDHLSKVVKERYVGEYSNDSVSILFSVLQVQMDCCGVNNGSDYSGSRVLNRTGMAGRVIPTSCCVNSTKLTTTDEVKKCVVDKPKDKVVSNYHKGCFDLLIKYVNEYTDFVFGGILGATGFLLILSILGWLLFVHALRQDKVEDIH